MSNEGLSGQNARLFGVEAHKARPDSSAAMTSGRDASLIGAGQ